MALAAACAAGGDAQYGPAEDDAAMAVILSAWSDGATAALSLCEDVPRAEEWTGPSCNVDHVVRAGGLGLSHEVEHPGGCGQGGCQYDAVAYVVGALTVPGLAGGTAVHGRVTLDGDHDGSPYAFPYRLLLSCDDAAQPCAIQGTLAADGLLVFQVAFGGAPASTGAEYRLARTGSSACPAPGAAASPEAPLAP